MSFIKPRRESAESFTDKILGLLPGKLRADRQFRHANHAIQWRSDLMTHIGEKFALRLVRRIRRKDSLLEFSSPLLHSRFQILRMIRFSLENQEGASEQPYDHEQVDQNLQCVPREELHVVEVAVKRHVCELTRRCSDERKNDAVLEGVALPGALQQIVDGSKSEKHCGY